MCGAYIDGKTLYTIVLLYYYIPIYLRHTRIMFSPLVRSWIVFVVFVVVVVVVCGDVE